MENNTDWIQHYGFILVAFAHMTDWKLLDCELQVIQEKMEFREKKSTFHSKLFLGDFERNSHVQCGVGKLFWCTLALDKHFDRSMLRESPIDRFKGQYYQKECYHW